MAKRLTAAEQARRNEQIVADRLGGVLTWDEIAARHDLSGRQCEAIFAQYKTDNPPLRERDPLAIVDLLIDGYLADLSEATRVLNSADNDSARIGAINSRRQVRERIAELLQATGTLPLNLGDLKILGDFRLAATRIVAVLREYDAPPEMVTAMRRALELDEPAGLPAGNGH